jgi:site-specific DNA-cytosine methylase
LDRAWLSIELFSGSGGVAWAMHKAASQHVLMNEVDHRACQTCARTGQLTAARSIGIHAITGLAGP